MGRQHPGYRGKTVSYEPDHKSFGEFMVSEQMRGVTSEVSGDIGKRASNLTPRRKHGITPPGAALADKFKVEREAGVIAVDGNPRVLVNVVNDSDHAAAVEFGSKKGKRHRMLGRAGAEFGDFKPDGGPSL